MKLPEVTIEQLLDAGIHFGHNTRRWNPKMEQYIFGVRNNIHIFDLRLTVPLINKALENNDADYITDVNVIESDHLIIFFGVKSIKISGEGWKKIDGEQNILKKPYFNPQTGELITD